MQFWKWGHLRGKGKNKDLMELRTYSSNFICMLLKDKNGSVLFTQEWGQCYLFTNVLGIQSKIKIIQGHKNVLTFSTFV